jgi:carbon-monoxide dehydrogenase large subunit
MMATRFLGASVQRIEDMRLLRGEGKYLDDLHFPALFHAAFVRSSHAHARIRSIDVAAARSIKGVHHVFVASDLGEAAERPMPLAAPHPLIRQPHTQPALAVDEVCYVGQPIAVVIAQSRYLAEDAAALVVVDYDVLPAVADCVSARRPDSARAHADAGDNIAAVLKAGFGNCEQAIASADIVISDAITMDRGGCHSMEGRGVIASVSASMEELTVWTSTQAPYMIQKLLARHLQWGEQRVRVVAPDVGGGFGPKAVFYPEEIIIPLVALKTRHPVKWTEDRREHFLATTQQRTQQWTVDIAATVGGKILGLRGRGIHDAGAFLPYGVLLPLSSLWPFPGPYAIPSLDLTLDVVFTNKVATSPVRGAGRPYAAFVIERCIDRVAQAAGISAVEVRRRNFVKRDQFPYATGMTYRDGSAVTYDSGDFDGLLERAVSMADCDGFEDRRIAAAGNGRLRGIGVASCIEDTGAGPFEGVAVRILPTGRIHVVTGAASQGQGHATIVAQMCAEQLGVSLDAISVTSADTGQMNHGMGTYGSRIAVAAGNSAFVAARLVREKALSLAANLLQARPDDLTIVDGEIRRKDNAQGTALSLASLAESLAGVPGLPLPQGFSPGLEATEYYPISAPTTAAGTHIAEVEIDPELGEVQLVRYCVAHDCGTVLNPLLVDGQILGGVVHGIGNALFEEMKFDSSAQPVSTNYGEYLLPTASEVPRIDIAHIEIPSPLNPLGAKGAGEAGTIPAAAAIVAAIENALWEFEVRISHHPVSPQDVIKAVNRSKSGSPGVDASRGMFH